MAKKKKKITPVPPEVKFNRRMKRYLKRALILGAIGALYFFGVPIFMPSMAPQVNETKQGILLAADIAGRNVSQILGVTTQLTAEVLGRKNEIEEKGAEALVRETVDDLTGRIKKLPGEQVKKVKREFCADVIEEAAIACQASESGSED